MGFFKTITNLFSSEKDKNKDDIQVEIRTSTKQDTYDMLKITEKEYKELFQINYDKLIETREFAKFYRTITQLQKLTKDEYDRDTYLKLEISEEIRNFIYDKHQELLKQSTQYKKENNLNKAIETIFEAINKYPLEDNISSYFKIAYYYQLSKAWDKSWKIFQKVLDTVNPNDIEKYFSLNADVLTKQTEQLKREKNLKEYLYHYSISFYANLIKEMLHPAVWSPNRYFDDDKILIEQFDIKPLKNETLKNLYIDFNIKFLNSKKKDILKLYEYLSQKEFELNTDSRNKNIMKELLKPLDSLELENKYNEELSNELINVNWNKK